MRTRILPTLVAALVAFFAVADVALAKSGAYNAGYIIGRIVFIVLVVALLVWVIRKVFGRGRDRAST
jgi:hypothetical protein